MTRLRIALFVEGSFEQPPPRDGQWLERIWNRLLVDALDRQRFSHVFPMSKLAVAALDPTVPTSTGAAEPLDQLMVRHKAGEEFDAAVVAWDLYPAWDPRGSMCRWAETVTLYEKLGTSDVLPDAYREYCSARHRELSSRTQAGARSGPPKLSPGAVLTLCMEPEFEAILTFDGAAARRAFELAKQPKDWPGDGAPPTSASPATCFWVGPWVGCLATTPPAAGSAADGSRRRTNGASTCSARCSPTPESATTCWPARSRPGSLNSCRPRRDLHGLAREALVASRFRSRQPENG